jgi:hypothetical protein
VSGRFPRALIEAACAAVVVGTGSAAHASALAQIARDLAEAIKDVPTDTWVVAAPVASDVQGTRADELAVRVAGLVAGRVGKGARPHDRAIPFTAARSHARESAALLFVTPVLEKGRLSVTADLYSVPKNSWDRIRMPALAPRAHGYAQATIDAEVRAFLPAIVLEQAAITKGKVDDAEVLAAACGDADGDGGLEVALVSRTKVSLGRFVRGAFRVERSTPWPGLSARAPNPLREPIATAAFEEDRLLVGITDRGGVALDAELASSSRLRGLPINAVGIEACANTVPVASALEGAGFCSPLGPTGPKLAVPVQRYDAISAALVIGKDGAESNAVAAREPQGKVRVRFGAGDGETRALDGGAELAVYDLDLDGAPEVAISNDSATEDGISIFSFARGSEPRLKRKIPTPAPVRALAACPPEARGLPGLLAVVGAEVWLVR